jgi:hypothetical protein|uniref:Thioredoxin family protein n=1 Tax=Desulfobacca acetoxidans TaxID=60893 RepID=A0A7V6A2Q3_9BACT
MNSPPFVEVVVYDAPAARKGGCDCGCDHHQGDQAGHPHRHSHGPCLSRPNLELETLALALTLEKAFPGRVRVEYINVLQDPRGPTLPQTKLLCSLIYPPPLVYLNGKGRFAGALPVERIREEVARILASES